MRRMQALLAALMVSACPAGQAPEGGTLLTYARTGQSMRAVLERRLAFTRLKCSVSEDERALSIRVPEATSVEAVRAVVEAPGGLEFCEAAPTAQADAGVPMNCLRPHLLAGELRESGRATVTWDDESARQVAEMTRRLVGHQLYMVIGGQLASTVDVTAPITGNRSMIVLTPAETGVEARTRSLAAVVSGPIEGLRFTSQRRYGPPRLW